MIVGDDSDLNVYKTAGGEGTDIGCCGPINTKQPSCSGGKGHDREAEQLKDLDLNEWAGEMEYQIAE